MEVDLNLVKTDHLLFQLLEEGRLGQSVSSEVFSQLLFSITHVSTASRHKAAPAPVLHPKEKLGSWAGYFEWLFYLVLKAITLIGLLLSSC